MKFDEIKKFIKKRKYLLSEHADEERTKDQLTVVEIEEAILSGKVIKERLDDPRGESRLVIGTSKSGRIIYIVIGIRERKPVIVTVYISYKTL